MRQEKEALLAAVAALEEAAQQVEAGRQLARGRPPAAAALPEWVLADLLIQCVLQGKETKARVLHWAWGVSFTTQGSLGTIPAVALARSLRTRSQPLPAASFQLLGDVLEGTVSSAPEAYMRSVFEIAALASPRSINEAELAAVLVLTGCRALTTLADASTAAPAGGAELGRICRLVPGSLAGVFGGASELAASTEDVVRLRNTDARRWGRPPPFPASYYEWRRRESEQRRLTALRQTAALPPLDEALARFIACITTTAVNAMVAFAPALAAGLPPLASTGAALSFPTTEEALAATWSSRYLSELPQSHGLGVSGSQSSHGVRAAPAQPSPALAPQFPSGAQPADLAATDTLSVGTQPHDTLASTSAQQLVTGGVVSSPSPPAAGLSQETLEASQLTAAEDEEATWSASLQALPHAAPRSLHDSHYSPYYVTQAPPAPPAPVTLPLALPASAVVTPLQQVRREGGGQRAPGVSSEDAARAPSAPPLPHRQRRELWQPSPMASVQASLDFLPLFPPLGDLYGTGVSQASPVMELLEQAAGASEGRAAPAPAAYSLATLQSNCLAFVVAVLAALGHRPPPHGHNGPGSTERSLSPPWSLTLPLQNPTAASYAAKAIVCDALMIGAVHGWAPLVDLAARYPAWLSPLYTNEVFDEVAYGGVSIGADLRARDLLEVTTCLLSLRPAPSHEAAARYMAKLHQAARHPPPSHDAVSVGAIFAMIINAVPASDTAGLDTIGCTPLPLEALPSGASPRLAGTVLGRAAVVAPTSELAVIKLLDFEGEAAAAAEGSGADVSASAATSGAAGGGAHLPMPLALQAALAAGADPPALHARLSTPAFKEAVEALTATDDGVSADWYDYHVTHGAARVHDVRSDWGAFVKAAAAWGAALWPDMTSKAATAYTAASLPASPAPPRPLPPPSGSAWSSYASRRQQQAERLAQLRQAGQGSPEGIVSRQLPQAEEPQAQSHGPNAAEAAALTASQPQQQLQQRPESQPWLFTTPPGAALAPAAASEAAHAMTVVRIAPGSQSPFSAAPGAAPPPHAADTLATQPVEGTALLPSSQPSSQATILQSLSDLLPWLPGGAGRQ